MKLIRNFVFIVITSAHLLAFAEPSHEDLINYYWQSDEVIQEVGRLALKGLIYKRGPTYVVPRFLSIGSSGARGMSYLVSQQFESGSIYNNATSVVALVSANAAGVPNQILVLNLPLSPGRPQGNTNEK